MKKLFCLKIVMTSCCVLQASFPLGDVRSHDENKALTHHHSEQTGLKDKAANPEDDDASEGQPQYPKCHIDEQCIRRDLSGKSLCELTIGEQTLSRIKIRDAQYWNNKAVFSISLKATNHVRKRPGWIGRHGECRLVYEYENDGWNLTDMQVVSATDLTLYEIENIRKTDGFPFLVAVDEGDLETIALLIEDGVNIYHRSRKGETALMIAAGRGHVDVARILIKQGVPVDAVTPDGRTALMIAANRRKPEMVGCLLNHGADPNCRGPLGCTALLLALERQLGLPEVTQEDRLAVLENLLTKGADPNVKDDTGITPIWLVIQNGDNIAAQLLIKKGANVNMRAGPEGYTPLMEAVKASNLTLVRALLKGGANVNVQVNGVTPMHLARASPVRSQEKLELIHALKAAGAER